MSCLIRRNVLDTVRCMFLFKVRIQREHITLSNFTKSLLHLKESRKTSWVSNALFRLYRQTSGLRTGRAQWLASVTWRHSSGIRKCSFQPPPRNFEEAGTASREKMTESILKSKLKRKKFFVEEQQAKISSWGTVNRSNATLLPSREAAEPGRFVFRLLPFLTLTELKMCLYSPNWPYSAFQITHCSTQTSVIRRHRRKQTGKRYKAVLCSIFQICSS